MGRGGGRARVCVDRASVGARASGEAFEAPDAKDCKREIERVDGWNGLFENLEGRTLLE